MPRNDMMDELFWATRLPVILGPSPFVILSEAKTLQTLRVNSVEGLLFALFTAWADQDKLGEESFPVLGVFA